MDVPLEPKSNEEISEALTKIEEAVKEKLSKLKPKKPRKVKIEGKIRLLSPSLTVRRLEEGKLYPPDWVKKLELEGISQEWHRAYILPFLRNFLSNIRAFKQKWRVAEEREVKMAVGSEEPRKVKFFVADAGIAHIFVSNMPFLWCRVPLNAKTWYEASLKAVIIYNPLDKPINVAIINLNHQTVSKAEIPPDSILIFIHKFKESMALKERKEELERELEKIKHLSPETRKLLEKYIHYYLIHRGQYTTYEKYYEKERERQLRRLLEELKKTPWYQELVRKVREEREKWLA